MKSKTKNQMAKLFEPAEKIVLVFIILVGISTTYDFLRMTTALTNYRSHIDSLGVLFEFLVNLRLESLELIIIFGFLLIYITIKNQQIKKRKND